VEATEAFKAGIKVEFYFTNVGKGDGFSMKSSTTNEKVPHNMKEFGFLDYQKQAALGTEAIAFVK
jgi:hypothetical protein